MGDAFLTVSGGGEGALKPPLPACQRGQFMLQAFAQLLYLALALRSFLE